MEVRFDRMAIIGVGLLGGSLGKACIEKGLVKRIVGFGRTEIKLKMAVALGAVQEYSLDLKSAVKDADLVVLCTPVLSFGDLMERMKPHLKPGCILTDVGSVKGQVIKDVSAHLPDGVHFVPSHPIAGGDQTGVEHSSAGLFCNRHCIVTPVESNDPQVQERVVSLWESVDGRVTVMTPEEHDRIFSGVSHLPHVAAFALVNLIGEMKSNGVTIDTFAGQGYMDSTRIAKGDPAMWSDICLANRDEVLKGIDGLQMHLNQMRSLIENNNGAELQKEIRKAQQQRESLESKVHQPIVAIDGPVGSGKSTLAKELARRLNLRHIETGSMYRAVAYNALQKNIDIAEEDKVTDIAKALCIDFVPSDNGQRVMVKGNDVTQLLREEKISQAASLVAKYPGVRAVLTEKQREMGRTGNVVMEGRDIGTVVFPDADKKFFIDADPVLRGKRRYEELVTKDPGLDLEDVIHQVRQRDHEDRNREVAPLKQAEDAIAIDTTQLTIQDALEILVRLIQTS